MRKMDEMELGIRLRAIKWTHAYIMVFLLVWMVYNWLKVGLCGPELPLICTANILLVTLQQVFTARVTGDRKPLLWLAAGVGAAVLVIALGTLLLVGAGAR